MARYMRFRLEFAGTRRTRTRRQVLEALDQIKQWVSRHMDENQGADVDVCIDVPLQADEEPEESF